MIETWRLFFDNLFDRTAKATFTGTHMGGTVAGNTWQRAVDGSRNSTFRVNFQGVGDIQFIATWGAGSEIRPVAGQWALGLMNHNLRISGAATAKVEVSATAGGVLTQVLSADLSAIPTTGGEPRDFDYLWLSDQTVFTLPIGELRVTINFPSPATDQVYIGQVMVMAGYIDTDGGPLAPTETVPEALNELRRTSSGDPSVTPALSQSQMVNLTFPVQSHAAADNYQKLIAYQRNALPYAITPHTVPTNGTWRGPGGTDANVEGRGMAWMVSPLRSRLTFLNDDRYTVRLGGLRQKGLGQWE